jgi:hypothetical protein
VVEVVEGVEVEAVEEDLVQVERYLSAVRMRWMCGRIWSCS